MTAKEAREAIDELMAQGETEDEIIAVFYQMFIDDKLTLEEFGNLLGVMDYELTEEFLNMSPEDQKTKGWEEDENEVKEDANEREAKDYEYEHENKNNNKNDEEEERERARKLYGFKN